VEHVSKEVALDALRLVMALSGRDPQNLTPEEEKLVGEAAQLFVQVNNIPRLREVMRILKKPT